MFCRVFSVGLCCIYRAPFLTHEEAEAWRVKSPTQDYTATTLTGLGYDYKQPSSLISAPNLSPYCPNLKHVEIHHMDPIKEENLSIGDHNGSDGERELLAWVRIFVVWVGGFFRSSELTDFSAGAEWILLLTALCPSKEMGFVLWTLDAVSLFHLVVILRIMNTKGEKS